MLIYFFFFLGLPFGLAESILPNLFALKRGDRGGVEKVCNSIDIHPGRSETYIRDPWLSIIYGFLIFALLRQE